MAVLLAVTLLLAGCGKDDEDKTPSAAAAPGATPSSAGPTTRYPVESAAPGKPEITRNPDGTVNSGGPRPATQEAALTAGGFGPYRIGVSQQELESAGLVGPVRAAGSDNCPGYATATGTDRYHSPSLVFFKSRLLRLSVDEFGLGTDQNVQIGAPLATVQKQYPKGKQIDDWTGRPAWLAATGDYALLFEMRDGKVSVIQAGMTEPMTFRYTDNQGC
jgi:hypothetical protein